MTQEQVEQEKKKIDAMSRKEMCRLHRFAKSGHPYFVTGSELNDHWENKWKELGGFTPEISKEIGWRNPKID